MSEHLAILMCCLGVAVLFYLDRNKSVRNSKALWLPVIWIGLAGSRGVSGWFGMGPRGLEGTLEGNPLDAAVFGALLAIGVIVLLVRSKKTSAYLAVTIPIIVYSVYCLISVSWAFYPVPAFKRWIKDVGDVVMVLILCTDPQPLEAIRRLYSRLSFVLFPFSLVLIRYSTLGRAWDNDGNVSITGVTTNKNMLGLIVFVISLGVLWNFRWLLMSRDEPNRGRRLVAQGIVLASGLTLLGMAHSSTSLACFLLGSGLMFVTNLRAIRRHPSRVHLLCMVIILAGGCVLLFGGMAEVANALGRESNLSGRTYMWAAMFPAVTNPLIGVGFDSFWTSPNAHIFHYNLSLLHWYNPDQINEAHNGYIEVYLNLGWIGVCLIATILATGYWRAIKVFGSHRELGILMLVYMITGMIYGITEAGFRTLAPSWMFILIAVISVSGARAGMFGAGRTRHRAPHLQEEWAGGYRSLEGA